MSFPVQYENKRNEELSLPGEIIFTVSCDENAGAVVYNQISSHYRTKGLRTANDVREVSPPRVTKMVGQFGLYPGYALALTS
jgi:hypothetical protein